jgi:hypothetical protein
MSAGPPPAAPRAAGAGAVLSAAAATAAGELASVAGAAVSFVAGGLTEARDLARARLRETVAETGARLRETDAAVRARLAAAGATLRARLGGLDASGGAAARAARDAARARDLFSLLARPVGVGGGEARVRVEDLEDLFGEAGLTAARTEAGLAAYAADAAGRGALTAGEFASVLGTLSALYSAAPSLLPPRVSRRERGGGGGGGGTTSASSTAGVSFFFGAEGASLSLREVVFRTLEEPTFSPLSRAVAAVLFTAIFVAVAIFVAQTMPAYMADGGGAFFARAEMACLAVFLLDYGLRLALAPARRAWAPRCGCTGAWG